MGVIIREQKATIVGVNTPIVEELRHAYPIRNNPQYPSKCVYTSEGHSWHLNDIRLQVWAQHIVHIFVYFNTRLPSTSVHFTESQKLHPPNHNTLPVPIPAAPTAAPAHQYPIPYGYAPPLHPHQYPPPYPYLPYPAYPPMLPLPCSDVPTGGSTLTLLAKLVLPCIISLAEFCLRYEIDDEDQDCLTKLKFQPGDQCVDKLEHEDWHGHVGFLRLSWDDFLSKHKQFIRDVKAGNWA
ncbi:hypothetical protein M413DRAFT_22978 [Hebeloma cylindrosporum]|uniref:Uncharacterized protein n=1 Tax=Hebeloma cylindrosporum TaxID=76867 RepID=A0A0C2YFI8_HEBCY|nr:hypothetical protein M413DRAFT_22978 [Hebeloma cylindrosporum h7]